MSWKARLAMSWLLLVMGSAALVELIRPEDWLHQNLDRVLWAPGWPHLFGTDSLGRDLLARLLVGTKVSLTVGILGSLLAMAIGLTYGVLAGWRGGWWDRLAMRFTDVLQAVPSFALVAVLTTAVTAWMPPGESLTKSVFALVAGIGLTHWMNIARVSRGLVMKTRNLPYVEAARSLGARDGRILVRHVGPNIAGPLLMLLGLQIPANILYESFMSFIGIGVQPPETSWGLLVQEGWRSLTTFPHLILFPSLVLFLTVWSLHLLMDELREKRTGTRRTSTGEDRLMERPSGPQPGSDLGMLNGR